MADTYLKRAAKLLFLFLLSSFLFACSKPQPSYKQLTGFTMGTSYHVTVMGEGLDNEHLQIAIDTRLEALNKVFSTYIDDSELSLLNQAAVGQWLELSPELNVVLEQSLNLAVITGGAFDVTVGPLVNAWGFGPEKQTVAPTDEQISTLLSQVGYKHLELSEGRIYKHKAVYIDLSSVAKGYAVDQVALLLREQGARNFMVEIGGELYVEGMSPRKTLWRVAIEKPGDGYGEIHKAISLSNKAVATSGDYRNYYEYQGKRYSHTINPVTGKPVEHQLASATVVADDCATADALATALNVLGPEKGLALARKHQWGIYLLVKADEGFEAIHSDAFKTYLD